MSNKVSRKRFFKSLADAELIKPYLFELETPYTKEQRIALNLGVNNNPDYTAEALFKMRAAVEQVRSWRLPVSKLHLDTRWGIDSFKIAHIPGLGSIPIDIGYYRGIGFAKSCRIGDPKFVLMHCDGRWSNVTSLFVI